MTFGIKNSKIIEVKLTVGKLTYFLGRQDVIHGRRVTGVVVDPAGRKAYDSGQTLASVDNVYLILRNLDNDVPVELPLANIRYDGTTPFLQQIPLEWDKIDWDQTKIVFAPGSTVTANTSIQMTVFYE